MIEEIPWTGWSLAAALISAAIYALVSSGRVSFRSTAPRERVEHPSRPSDSSLAELLERMAFVESDGKKLRREWADQEESFNRRWGSMTRQMRRDGKRDQDDQTPADADDTNLDQIELLPQLPAQQPTNGAAPRRLVALSQRMRG